MNLKNCVVGLVAIAAMASPASVLAQETEGPGQPGTPTNASALSTSEPASAPRISGFSGKFESGETAELFGERFGRTGDLLAQPGPVTKDSLPTRAVVLGDAPRLADCRILHQQKTMAWSSSAIDLEFHVPQNAADRLVYLFVIDETGTSSGGLGPLVPGVGFPPPGPGAPGQPETGF